MTRHTLSLLLACGLAVPACAAGQARPDATSGYGMTSGGTPGMHAEAGADARSEELAGLPQPRTAGDVTWMCGGIGMAEADYMRRQARDFDLKLSFASADGAYLADVEVNICGPGGESVLSTKCEGPIMLVDLPRDGIYRIEADAGGFRKTRTVRVGSGRERAARQVVIAWPREEVARMEASARASGGAGGSSD